MSQHSSTIPVRRPGLDFDADIDRYYLEGNALRTHFFNALNLAFPDGERFFVRSVADHRADLDDPALLAEVRGFSGQEGQHANQHERFFRVLERQGYEVKPLLRGFRRIARLSNRYLPRALRLSITAGAEHYTATMASLVLSHDMVQGCHPVMRDLIQWHAIEEIEHKHVAYDVLVRVYPRSYLLRMLGFGIATAFIAGWTFFGMRTLLLQDGRAGRLSRADYLAARRGATDERTRRYQRAVRRHLLRYLRPGFHPNQHDDTPLLDRFRPLIEQRLLAAPA